MRASLLATHDIVKGLQNFAHCNIRATPLSVRETPGHGREHKHNSMRGTSAQAYRDKTSSWVRITL